MTRAFSTLVGAAVAGGLVWVAAQVDRDGTGGYWAVIGILAGAGLVLTLARLPGPGFRDLALSAPALGLAFVPALVATGWVVVAAQPHGNTVRSHVLEWSGDIGILRVVRDLGPYAPVLAFGLGALLGLALEGRVGVVTRPLPAEEAVPTGPGVEEDAREPELVGHS